MSAKRWFWLSPILLLILLFTASFTPYGSRLVVAVLDKFTPLDIEYSHGSLARELTLIRLGLKLESVAIELHSLSVDIDLACIFYSRVCFEQLSLEELVVDFPAGKAEETNADPQTVTPVLIEFPVALEADRFSIANTRISWSGGGWKSGLIEGGFIVAGSQLRLSDIRGVDPHLTIEISPDEAVDPVELIQLPQLHLPVELIVEGLLLEQPHWQLGELSHQHDVFRLIGKWQHSVLDITHASISSKGWGDLSLAGRVEFLDDWPLVISANTQLTEPPVWIGLHDREIEISLSGTLADLKVMADMPGAQQYQLAGAVNTLAQGLPFDSELTVSWSVPLNIDDIPGVAGELPQFQLHSPMRLKADGSSDLWSFSFQGGAEGLGYDQLELALSGHYRNNMLWIDTADLHDASTDSALVIEGTVSFEDALQWNLALRSSGAKIPELGDMLSGRLNGSLVTRGTWAEGQWQAGIEAVDLQGEINNMPARASGSVSVNDQLYLSNSNVFLSIKESELAITSRRGDASRDADLLFELNVQNLGRWLDETGGSVSVSGSVEQSRQRLVFEGFGEELHWQGIDVSHGHFEGNYALADDRDFDLSLALSEIAHELGALDILTLAVSSSAAQQNITLVSRGDVAANLQVEGAFFGSTGMGALEATEIVSPVGTWVLGESVAIEWEEGSGRLTIAQHCWTQDSASLCSGEIDIGEEGSGSLVFIAGMELFDTLLPAATGLDGILDFAADAQWSSGAGLVANARADVSPGSFTLLVGEEQLAVDWEKASFTASLDSGALGLSGEMWRNQSRQLNLKLAIPADGSQKLDGSLSILELDLAGILKPLIPFFPELKGRLNGELALSGTGNAPLLNGEVRLTDGSFSVVGNPTTFEEISLTMSAVGDRADLAGSLLVGTGPTKLTGRVSLRPEVIVELGIEGEQQALFMPPSMEATVSEKLELVAKKDSLELRGIITVLKGVLEHEQLPAGSIDVSSDIVEVDYAGNVVSETSAFDLIADIQVNILDTFDVVGTGLWTTVGGSLDLKKASALPLQLTGELNIIEGEIEAFGQSLDILRGNISFVGEPDNPDLNLRAERDIPEESIKVGVEVLGNLEDFTFNVYSNPALSKSQAMSYLIRGRGLDEGSETDGAALALSIGLGAFNKSGIVDGINSIPGLSEVSFGTEGDSSDTTAQVSGYVGKRLYLAYGVGLYEPINVLTTRFYLQSQLWLEVVSSLNSSADIYYSFAID